MSQSQFRAPRGKLKKITEEEEELTDEQKKKVDERAALVKQAQINLSKFEFGGSKTKRKTRRTKRRTKRKTKKTKRKTKKNKRKTKRKNRKTKRRTRKKRGRGPMFSKPAKVAAIGALALGSAAAVSPAAKQTYQEIMQSDCNAPFRQMVKPHHPDKGGTIDDFSFVEKARQSRKKSCGSTQTKTSKPERRAGESGKAARKRHNRTEKARRATEREQADRQEEADRRAGQQNKEEQEETDSNTGQQAEQSAQEETNYGDLAGKGVAAAAALGALEYARRYAGPGYGPNNPRPQRPRTPPRNR